MTRIHRVQPPSVTTVQPAWESLRFGDDRFSVAAGRSPHGSTCSCGMPIPTDAAVLRIVHSSEVSRGLFDGFDFHGPMCLNAYLLEGLALIEGMQDDKSASVCADLRELVAALRYARDKLAAAGFV